MTDTPNRPRRVASVTKVRIYTTLTADRLTHMRWEMLTDKARAADRALEIHDCDLDTPSGKQDVRDVLEPMRALSAAAKPKVSP